MRFCHVLSPAESFFSFSFCLVYCVWGLLSAGWVVVVPLSYGDCSLWVGLDQWLVKVFWLGEFMSVFCWMELDLFSLEGNAVSSREFWGVYGFCIALDSPSFNVQGYVCFVGRLACRVLHWSLLALGWNSVSVEYGGFGVGYHVLIFPGVRSFMMVQSSQFEPPLYWFQSPSYSSFKIFLSTQHRR